VQTARLRGAAAPQSFAVSVARVTKVIADGTIFPSAGRLACFTLSFELAQAVMTKEVIGRTSIWR
jgi:hypothetical protein